MRRSLLFIPGNREKMLNKAETCEADVIIFDLEDSVPENDKENGRQILKEFLTGFVNAAEKELIIRINACPYLWKKEIVELSSCNQISAFMIPKANVELLREMDLFLNEVEIKLEKPIGTFRLIPLIESPQSIIDVHNIATSSSRIMGMLFGAEDFVKQMNISRTVTGEEILVARSIFTMACSAAGIEAYDTPFTDINNMAGLEWDTNRGKSLGMTGKAAIHPNQISVIQKIFTPQESEIEKARRIIEGNEIAVQKGQGSFLIDNEMVDMPIVLRAKKLLDSLDIENYKMDERIEK